MTREEWLEICARDIARLEREWPDDSVPNVLLEILVERAELISVLLDFAEAAGNVTCWQCATEDGRPNPRLQPTCPGCARLRELQEVVR